MSTPHDPVVLQFAPGLEPRRIDIQSPRASGPDAEDVVRRLCEVTGIAPDMLIFEPVAGEEAWRCWIMDMTGKRACRITWSLDHAIGTGAFIVAAKQLTKAGWRPTSPQAQGAAA